MPHLRPAFRFLLPLVLLGGCGTEGSVLDRDAAARFDTGPACTPTASSESSCSGRVDEDCDGYIDCLDPDCEANSCGGVEFEPVAGARDYRIYRYPAAGEVSVGADGEISIRDAIYRCAGMRPLDARETNPAGQFDASLAVSADAGSGYARTEAEAILGYVYLTPAEGRQPVYRMADPNGSGGFFNSDWVVPIYAEANSADYVVGTAERDRLLADGFRDDGVGRSWRRTART